MVDFKKLQEMDVLLANIDSAQDKARIIAEGLTQKYFSFVEDEYKLFYYNNASLKSNIVYDYIFEVAQNMSKLLEIFDEVFKEARAENVREGKTNVFPDAGKAV